MNSRLSYTKAPATVKEFLRTSFWVVIVFTTIIVFTNLEFYLVSNSSQGTYAPVYVFVIYYCEEFVFLLLSYVWILPLLKRKIPRYPLIMLITITWLTSGAIFSNLIKIYIYYLHDRTQAFGEIVLSFFNALYRHGILFMVFSAVYGFWLWIKERVISHRNQNLVNELTHENMQLQTSLLGIQMNPHLMVNVLNAIQGNIMEKSPESFHLISGIAGIQEHLLTKSGTEQLTTLADEIELVQKVLKLYKELGQKLENFNLLVNAPIEKILFPANLLVPLIENIFKHGDINDLKDPPIVNLQIQPSFLELYIRNKALLVATSQNRPRFGIRNCIKRLDAYFANRYKFMAFTKEQHYQLILEIKLENYD